MKTTQEKSLLIEVSADRKIRLRVMGGVVEVVTVDGSGAMAHTKLEETYQTAKAVVAYLEPYVKAAQPRTPGSL